jgi:hypothetical protein
VIDGDDVCSRIDRAEGYYEFVFEVANRRSIDVLFQHLNALYLIHQPPGVRFRALLDFTKTDIPPIQPVAAQIREFRKTHPIPLNPRIVVIYSGAFVGMIDSLLRTFAFSRETQVRLFLPTRRDEALAWLLKD